MCRYTLYVAFSGIIIVLGVGELLFVYWDAYRPKTGPVGDGVVDLSFNRLLPVYSLLLLGFVNLPVAIMRYRKAKKSRQ